MRSIIIGLLVVGCCFGQRVFEPLTLCSDPTPSKVCVSQQAAESYDVYIGSPAVAALELWRNDESVKGNPFPDHSSIIANVLPALLMTFAMQAKTVYPAIEKAERLTISLTAAQNTKLELQRINTLSRPAVQPNGSRIQVPIFSTRGELMRSSILAGLVNNLMHRYVAEDVKQLVADQNPKEADALIASRLY